MKRFLKIALIKLHLIYLQVKSLWYLVELQMLTSSHWDSARERETDIFFYSRLIVKDRVRLTTLLNSLGI